MLLKPLGIITKWKAYFTGSKGNRSNSATYYVRTMATASFSTLSPNKSVYRSGSTCSSWKMASTVTRETQNAGLARTQLCTCPGLCLPLNGIHYISSQIHLLYPHRTFIQKKKKISLVMPLCSDFSGLPTYRESVSSLVHVSCNLHPLPVLCHLPRATLNLP